MLAQKRKDINLAETLLLLVKSLSILQNVMNLCQIQLRNFNGGGNVFTSDDSGMRMLQKYASECGQMFASFLNEAQMLYNNSKINLSSSSTLSPERLIFELAMSFGQNGAKEESMERFEEASKSYKKGLALLHQLQNEAESFKDKEILVGCK